MRAGVGLVLVVALGLTSRRLPLGNSFWDKSLGDALYTAMVYLLLTLGRPTLRPLTRGALALAFSIAIELFQLTGIPARLPRLLHLVFGTGFAWHDIACYVVGAVAATALETALDAWSADSGRVEF
jgi:Protein of unknown function (DUF2809)